MNAEELRKSFLAGVAAAAIGVAGGLLPIEVEAQNAPCPNCTPTTQSAYHADAGAVLAASTYTTCTTTQAAVAQGTLGVSIQPPAGWYVYLTGVFIEVGSNGTGTTTSSTAWSTTNFTGNPAWLVGSPGAVSWASQQVAEVYPTGLKANVAGQTITIAPVATLASSYTCAKFMGYFSPI